MGWHHRHRTEPVGRLRRHARFDTNQPYKNIKLVDNANAYDTSNPNASTLNFAWLTEPLRAASCAHTYPTNICGQTIHSGMSNQISALADASGRAYKSHYITAATAVGLSGQSITVIDKGGTGNAYAASLYEASAFKRLAASYSLKYGVGAVVLTHGETDGSRATYATDIYQLYNDYNADLKAITGQTQRVAFLLSQQHTFPGGTNGNDAFDPNYFAVSSYQQYRMAIEYPNQITVTGPKYQIATAAGGIHIDASGYHRVGEKYAQAYFTVVENQNAWLPTLPALATLYNPNQIIVIFHAPTLPLQFNADLPLPHQGTTPWSAWANGKGFEVFDANQAPIAINSAVLSPTHPDWVVLNLASPISTLGRVQYAMIEDSNTYAGGTATGRVGQLCDSDAFVGRNQAVHTCTLTNGSTALTCTTTLDERDLRDRVYTADGSYIGYLAGISSWSA